MKQVNRINKENRSALEVVELLKNGNVSACKIRLKKCSKTELLRFLFHYEAENKRDINFKVLTWLEE